MKKTILLVCAAMMLVLCFSATVTLAKQKDQCIELCTTTADNESDCSIVWLDSEGWFQVVNGDRYGQTGSFAWYGAAFVMQFSDECGSFFAGTAKRGFFECSSLDDRIVNPSVKERPEGFNTFVTKNIDKRNCEEMMKEGSLFE